MGAGAVIPTTDALLPPMPVEPAVAATLLVLALDVLRLCRLLVEGMENPDPDSRCCLPSGIMGISAPDPLADVDDALDTTEAF